MSQPIQRTYGHLRQTLEQCRSSIQPRTIADLADHIVELNAEVSSLTRELEGFRAEARLQNLRKALDEGLASPIVEDFSLEKVLARIGIVSTPPVEAVETTAAPIDAPPPDVVESEAISPSLAAPETGDLPHEDEHLD